MAKQFPIESVPIPRQTQPFQQPKTYDPADVIMQAAHLHLQEQGLQQKQQENLLNIIQSSAALMEHKREAMTHEANAQAMLDLKERMTPAEMGHLDAQTKLLQAQAKMYDESGGMQGQLQDMLQREALPPTDPRSLPPGTTANSMPKMGPMRSMLINAYSQNPQAGLGQAAINYNTAKKEAETMVGPAFKRTILGGESILQNFQSVVDMANQLGLSSFAPINKIKLAALRLNNDPVVKKYDTARSAVAEEMARYFGGGSSSDMKIKLGQGILGDDGADANAIQSSLLGTGGAYDVIQNQINAYKGNKHGISAPQIIERRLADGTKVKVKKMPDGTYQEVE